MEARAVRFSAGDGPVLEGRFAVPPLPAGVAVLCHPYPPLDGSMSNALLPPLQRALFAAGWAALRFNFRGVGRSEGAFDGGRGEVDDVAAALAFVRREVPDAPVAVAGWSFGSIIGLIAAARDGAVVSYAGIAPPVSSGSRVELPATPASIGVTRALFVCGTQDPVARPQDVRLLADRYGGETLVVEGAGHFLEGPFDAVTDAVVGHFGGGT